MVIRTGKAREHPGTWQINTTIDTDVTGKQGMGMPSQLQTQCTCTVICNTHKDLNRSNMTRATPASQKNGVCVCVCVCGGGGGGGGKVKLTVNVFISTG